MIPPRQGFGGQVFRITDGLRPSGVEEFIRASVTLRVAAIQIREPRASARELFEIASRAVVLTRNTAVKIIVNERVDVAVAALADGVHLRASGPPVAAVRAIVPGRFLVGRSAHSVDEIDRAAGADYLIFGTVFSTPSKPGVEGQGLDALRGAVERFPGPVLAIGGVTAARVPEVLSTGAAGYAGIGMFQIQ